MAARAGYAARGIVYIILGCLTFLAAFSAASKTDTKGAIRTLLEQPFGEALVGLLVIGLASYVFWRLVQAFFDPDDHGLGVRGVFIRLALFVSALSYSTLALYAASLVFSIHSDGSEGGAAGSVVRSLNGFFSIQTISLGMAIVIAGVALSHWWKAFAGTYEQYFKADEQAMRIIRPISIIGLSARGLIFATISWLLVLRFLNRKEDSAGDAQPGLKHVLHYFSELPYGQWLLGGIGLGLVAFALYSLAESRWRRISTPDFT